jgi:hypothetical protein
MLFVCSLRRITIIFLLGFNPFLPNLFQFSLDAVQASYLEHHIAIHREELNNFEFILRANFLKGMN